MGGGGVLGSWYLSAEESFGLCCLFCGNVPVHCISGRVARLTVFLPGEVAWPRYSCGGCGPGYDFSPWARGRFMVSLLTGPGYGISAKREWAGLLCYCVGEGGRVTVNLFRECCRGRISVCGNGRSKDVCVLCPPGAPGERRPWTWT